MNEGMNKYRVQEILQEKIESDPDLKYYIDNEYITKLVNLLIEGIGEGIEENNEKLVENLCRRRR